MSRPWQHLAVAGFLAVQFGAPMSYYLTSRQYDERFAWRMFSPTRMIRCQARVQEWTDEGAVEVDLKREIAAPWLSWMKRGHAHILRGVGEHLCEERGPGARFTGDLVCTLPDGERDPVMTSEALCPE